MNLQGNDDHKVIHMCLSSTGFVTLNILQLRAWKGTITVDLKRWVPHRFSRRFWIVEVFILYTFIIYVFIYIYTSIYTYHMVIVHNYSGGQSLSTF